jgi:hypothetical protein
VSIVLALSAALTGLSPAQMAWILVAISLLLSVTSHALASLALWLLFAVLALLTAPYLISLVVVMRLALALAICAILFVSAQHAPNDRPVPAASQQSGERPAGAMQALVRRRARLLYRVPALALTALIAYSAWRAYPLASLPATLSLAGYWAMSLGLVLALSADDPLGRGIGLVAFVNGFEGLFLPAQRGLLTVGLVSILDMVIALAIVFTFEGWLQDRRLAEEAPR